MFSWPSQASSAEGDGGVAYEVTSDKAIVYSEPDTSSTVVRHLYVGEVVTAQGVITQKDGRKWVQIKLGESELGYVPESDLHAGESLPERRWKKREVQRNLRPLSFGVKAMGETGGGTLNFRYLPFTRLGLAMNIGAVLDDSKMKGTAFSVSAISLIALANISPLLEFGLTRLSYHAPNSTMVITAIYFTVGLEWMFRFGLFINAGITYVRSADIEIVHEFEDAVEDNMRLEKYGKFDHLKNQNAYQTLQPCFTIGYAF